MNRFYLALAPWAVFSIVVRDDGLDVAWGAALALATAALLALVGRSGAMRRIEAVAGIVFLALLIVGLRLGNELVLHAYARSIATGALAVALGASALHDPASAPFARADTAPRHWTDGAFLRFNLAATVVLAALLALVAGAEAAAAAAHGPVASTLCNWLLPALVVLGYAIVLRRALERRFERDEPTLREVIDELEASTSNRSRLIGLPRRDAEGGGPHRAR